MGERFLTGLHHLRIFCFTQTPRLLSATFAHLTFNTQQTLQRYTEWSTNKLRASALMRCFCTQDSWNIWKWEPKLSSWRMDSKTVCLVEYLCTHSWPTHKTGSGLWRFKPCFLDILGNAFLLSGCRSTKWLVGFKCFFVLFLSLWFGSQFGQTDCSFWARHWWYRAPARYF